MKITIITVCFNSESTIEDTINSIQNQDYHDIEYIVIDGGSTDNTLEIIKKNSSIVSKLISEPDKGIYDAMNKGLAMATGEITAIINSDDFYKNNHAISTVVKAFEQNVSIVYADIEYIDKTDHKKVVRYWKSGKFEKKKMKYGWMPPHPAFFVRTQVYKTYGFFNTQLKISADYELMLRLLYKHSLSVFYLNETLVSMRIGGVGNKSLKNRIRANKEDKLAWKINGLDYSFLTTILKPIRKIPQFIFKKNA